MAVFRIAWANLRRKRGSAISFAAIVLLAVMLLDTGLLFLFQIPALFDSGNERLNAPHYTVLIPNNEYKKDYSLYFENDPRVSAVETEEIGLVEACSYFVGQDKVLVLPNFFDAEKSRSILPLTLVEQGENVSTEDAIYLPLPLKQQGFKVGDPITFEIKQKQYTFRTAGFFESTWFASMNGNMLSFYLGSGAYRMLYEEAGGGKIISLRVHDTETLTQLMSDFRESTGIMLDSPGLQLCSRGYSINDMRSAGMIITNVISAMFSCFAIIVLLISLLIIRFRISNYIQDNMQSIGALEALGYTSGQLRGALTLECTVAGLAGGLAGVLSCYGITALLSGFLSAMNGVSWKMGVRFTYDLISLAGVLLVVCLISFFSTRKIRKLPPVTALRFGLHTHSFRRNWLPLEKPSGGLSLRLAGKAILANPGQYAMLALIVCAMSFATAFSVLLFQHYALDPTAFLRLSGIEMGDVSVDLVPHTDYQQISEELASRDGIEKVAVWGNSSVNLEELLVTVQISNQFEKLEMLSVYEGSFPQYDNEVAINGMLARRMNKKVGDSITLERSGRKVEYLICGLGQAITDFGKQCMLTVEGMRRLQPDYQVTTLCLYLEPGVDSAGFIRALEADYPPVVSSTENAVEADARRKAEEKLRTLMELYGVDSAQFALMDGDKVILSGDTSRYRLEKISDQTAIFANTVATYVNVIAMISISILILCILVIWLILHLVVSSTVLRRKREFGVYKALGYTSRQLRRQIALSFLPVSVPGVALGVILGGLLSGQLFSRLLYSMGVSNIEMAAHPLLLVATACGLLLFLFLTASFAAGPVKRVSVYELFTE